MNVVTRGMRGAFRSPLRAGAIIAMLAISIGLIIAMLAAKAGVENKIAEVKATSATGITIRPAGIMGFAGGGDPLTAEQVASITKTAHVASIVSTLTDQLGTDDTTLTPSIELGSFGQRQQRFEDSSGSSNQAMPAPPVEEGSSGNTRPTMSPRTTVTGTTDPSSVSTNGGDLALSSGVLIDGNSNENTALVGSSLAKKNNLSVGGTFTMYGQTFTVKGIFSTGNTFQDSGIIVPLKTLQVITGQLGAVTSVTANADSSDTVAAVVSSLKSTLGDKADITSEQQRAESSVTSLSSISGLATSGVISATIASAVIVLLMMTMIVRERRREIGVIKAIGGTNFKVISQFVTEALTLTVIGGIIGIGLGIAASGTITQSLVDGQANSTSSQTRGTRGGTGGNAMNRPGSFIRGAQQGLQNVTSSVSPLTIAGGIGLTLLIAIVGSALPAWYIARIRPAEVLRSE